MSEYSTIYSDEDWNAGTGAGVKIINHATQATNTITMLETAASVV